MFNSMLDDLEQRSGMRSSGWRYGINPNDDEYASKLNAQLTHRQWANYQDTYLPIHDQLFRASMSHDLANEQLARTKGNVDRAYDANQAAKNTRMQRYGLSDVDDDSLERAKSLAHANNSIRSYDKERRSAAVAGGATAAMPERN